MGGERENIGELSLLEVLGRLPDPRSGHGRRHPLGAILGLAPFPSFQSPGAG